MQQLYKYSYLSSVIHFNIVALVRVTGEIRFATVIQDQKSMNRIFLSQCQITDLGPVLNIDLSLNSQMKKNSKLFQRKCYLFYSMIEGRSLYLIFKKNKNFPNFFSNLMKVFYGSIFCELRLLKWITKSGFLEISNCH